MINHIISLAIRQRVMVALACILLSVIGAYAVVHTPVDAIPDLSEVQVIVKTPYAGQGPQVVEDQITYPLTTALLSVPKAKTVRGFSFFGDSYIYVIFDEGTDLYWARSRVQEYLAQASSSLPRGVKPELGPDATGVGWVYMYALKDTSGSLNLAELTSIQDWNIRYALQAVSGVSEVATVGGMKKRYLVEVDPIVLLANRLSLTDIKNTIVSSNYAWGASVIEQAEAEYMLTINSELDSLSRIAQLPIKTTENGSLIRLKDIANVIEAPNARRAVADLNGQGEVVGGVVVMRSGENPQATIKNVKARLEALAKTLPEGVEIVTVYDRSTLISASISNLWEKLWQELLVVFLVTAVFLFHIRSALVALVLLPVGLLLTFLCLRLLDISINIMSLGGIALAMGAMVDAAVVMVENLHRKYRHYLQQHPDGNISAERHWQLTREACGEVGPAIFFSLLIITISFFPVFALQAEEGKLFSPLAYTKSFAMGLAAVLGITLVPVLTGWFISGKSLQNHHHHIDSWLVNQYQRLLMFILGFPKTVMFVSFALCMSALYPASKVGSEFMPPLNEGDIMYMPTTAPGISVGKARELLQQAHRIIVSHPEVAQVFGKAGRADSATDPAPLSMIESVIQLKPASQWRTGVTLEQIKAELDASVDFPGLNNAWLNPIRTRIDMQSTGVKTPLGVRVSGDNLATLQELTRAIEQTLRNVQGTSSVYAEQPNSGRYIDIQIDRDALASFNLTIADVQAILQSAISGAGFALTREGRERYPISVRYFASYRDSREKLLQLPIVTKKGVLLTLGDIANVRYQQGPSVIKSENSQLSSWVYVDYDHPNITEYLQDAEAVIRQTVDFPAGYQLEWTGQYQSLQRANQRLQFLVPLTVIIIIGFLYMSFRRLREVMIVLITLPLAVSGSFWMLYWMAFKFSIAVAIGFIALAGLAVEIGVLMLVYLQQAVASKTAQDSVTQAVSTGAGRRIRPILMTALSVALGLLPILYDTGSGSEVMARIIAPVVGGIFSVLLFSLLLLPVMYAWLEQRKLPKETAR